MLCPDVPYAKLIVLKLETVSAAKYAIVVFVENVTSIHYGPKPGNYLPGFQSYEGMAMITLHLLVGHSNEKNLHIIVHKRKFLSAF